MNTLFLVALIIQALFGLGFVFAPAALLAPFGVTFDPLATSFARLFGAALIGYPILLWFARKSDHPGFRKAVVYSEFAYMLISSVLLVIITSTGQMNPLGWIIVAEHVILTIWFGYFLVK